MVDVTRRMSVVVGDTLLAMAVISSVTGTVDRISLRRAVTAATGAVAGIELPNLLEELDIEESSCTFPSAIDCISGETVVYESSGGNGQSNATCEPTSSVAPELQRLSERVHAGRADHDDNGYAPLGAAIATKRVADAFVGDDSKTFKHLITFGGHPVAAAAGIKNLEIMEREDLPGASARTGEYLLERLATLYEHPSVGNVRGLGLLAAVELVKDRDSKEAFPASAELMSRLPKKLYDRRKIASEISPATVPSPLQSPRMYSAASE